MAEIPTQLTGPFIVAKTKASYACVTAGLLRSATGFWDPQGFSVAHRSHWEIPVERVVTPAAAGIPHDVSSTCLAGSARPAGRLTSTIHRSISTLDFPMLFFIFNSLNKVCYYYLVFYFDCIHWAQSWISSLKSMYVVTNYMILLTNMKIQMQQLLYLKMQDT